MTKLDHPTPESTLKPRSSRSLQLLEPFLAAIQFITRVPIPSRFVTREAIHRAPIYFPIVGALIGVALVAVIYVGCLIWPVWLAVPVALALEARWTGALHEDAVADFCDAFGGGRNREHVLAILNDSRLGTYGVLGLLFAVFIRGAAIIAVIIQNGQTNFWVFAATIVYSSMVARWTCVLAMVLLAPVQGREGLAREVGKRLTQRHLLIASIPALPIALLHAYLQPLHFWIGIVTVAIAASWTLLRISRRIGGITGDCLGCIAYVSQVLVLLTSAIQFDHGSALP